VNRYENTTPQRAAYAIEGWYRKMQRNLFLTLVIITLFFALSACGSSRSSTTSSDSSPSAQRLAAPTMPSGNFVPVSQAAGVITETIVITDTPVAEGSQPNLELGERVYTKNKCGDCHGAKGEGVADKGKAIAGMPLSLNEFDVLLRTGGGLGNSHIFGRSAVSPSGMEALYAYVQSLNP
jgi:mono/diheme cytochrome c family protein